MASYHREVYEPSFEDDATYELQDDEVEDGRARLPLLIVVALLVLAAFAGVVWVAYNQGVARGRAGAPVVIAAPAAPLRTAPADQASNPPLTGLKVYGAPVSPDQEAAASALAPPPTITEVEAPPVPLPPSAALAPPASPPTPATAQKLVASIPAPSPAAAGPGPALTDTMLQIGAFPTRELAEAAWQSFKTRHASVIGTLPDDVREADLGAKGVWYRLRLGPFAEKAAASAMCERLKSEGAACFVAAP